MSTYAWIINKDYTAGDWLAKDKDGPYMGSYEACEVVGPSTCTEEQYKRLEKGEGRAFRLYDDDRYIYLSGRIIDSEEGSEDDFGPLDDYGTGAFGCTYIMYRDSTTGEWEVL